MKEIDKLKAEYSKLIALFGAHELCIVLGGLDGYKMTREYTTYKEVKNELNLICEPMQNIYPQQY